MDNKPINESASSTPIESVSASESESASIPVASASESASESESASTPVESESISESTPVASESASTPVESESTPVESASTPIESESASTLIKSPTDLKNDGNGELMVTGREIGKCNKIRDIIKYDDTSIMVVDHRNHRLQVLDSGNFDSKNIIDSVNDLPIILPGNIAIIKKTESSKILAFSTVRYNQHLTIISIDNDNKIKHLDTFVLENKDDFGPGGIIKLVSEDDNKSYLMVTSFFSGKLLLLEFDHKSNKFISYKYFDIKKKGIIDIVLWHNSILVLQSEGLGGVGKAQILEYELNEEMTQLNLKKIIQGINDKYFNFTHSAGSFDVLDNKLCIADTGNNRVLILEKIEDIDKCIISYDSVFPTSVCVFSNSEIYISRFHGIGKEDKPNSDHLIKVNLDSLEKKDFSITIDSDTRETINSEETSNLYNTDKTIFSDILEIGKYEETSDITSLMEEIFLNSPIHIAKRIKSEILNSSLEKMIPKKIEQNSDEKEELRIYQYKQELQTTMEGWNITSLLARGIIFNSENKIIATPFPKFWNCSKSWGGTSSEYKQDRAGIQISDLNKKIKNIGGGVRVEEKIDGSLGIIFYHNDIWRVSTKGSLTSSIGEQATLWMKDIKGLDTECTYLCEVIIEKDNLIVDYKCNAIVLLGGYDKYGYELSSSNLDKIVLLNNKWEGDDVIKPAKDLKNMKELINIEINRSYDGNFIFRRPVYIDSLHTKINFDEIAMDTRFWKNLGEGLVIIYIYNDKTSYRLKVKTDEFIEKQKAEKDVNLPRLIKLFKEGDKGFAELKKIDEEHYDDMIKYWNFLEKKILEFQNEPTTIPDSLLPEDLKTMKIEDNKKFLSIVKDDKFLRKIVNLDLLKKNFKPRLEEFSQPNLDLFIWLNELYTYCDNDIDTLIEYTKYYYDIEIKKVSGNILCIRYMESSHLWFYYIRQTRGLLVYYDETKKSFIILRQLLQRGYELNMKKEDNKPGLDINPKFHDILLPSSMEDKQTESLNLIMGMKGNDLSSQECYLSTKVDGSLCSVIVCKKTTPLFEILNKGLSEMEENPFIKLTKQHIESDEEWAIFISSQRTFILDYNSELYEWNLCAIAKGIEMIDYNEEEVLAGSSTPDESSPPVESSTLDESSPPVESSTPLDLKKSREKLKIHLTNTILPQFFKLIIDFVSNIDKSVLENPEKEELEIISLSFESVCKNRTTLFGVVKNLLATEYEHYMFRFLGLTINHGSKYGIYIPHFDNRLRRSFETVPFQTPFAFKLNSVEQLSEIIGDIRRVLFYKLGTHDFFKRYPILDICKLTTTVEYSKSYGYFDFEGFIYYRLVDGKYDYNKVKEPYFGKLHKLSFLNDKILEDIPPIVDNVYSNLKKLRTIKTVPFINIIKNMEKTDYESINNLLKNYGLQLNLLVYKSGIRSQGYVSFLWDYKDTIFDRTTIIKFNEYGSNEEDIPFLISCFNKLNIKKLIKNKDFLQKIYRSCNSIKISKISDNKLTGDNSYRVMTWNVLCERMFLKDNLDKLEKFKLPKKSKNKLSKDSKDKINSKLKELNDIRYEKILSIIKELNIDILLLQEADKVFLDKATEMGFDSEQLKESNKIFNYKKRIEYKKESLSKSKKTPANDKNNQTVTKINQSDAAFIYYNKEKLNSLNEKSFSFNSENGSTINVAVFDITSEQKLIVINIHIKLNWSEEDNIDKYVHPSIILQEITDKNIIINTDDRVIIGGDFNSYSVISENNETYNYKIPRGWDKYCNLLKELFFEKRRINGEEVIIGIPTINNGGEPDHLLTDLSIAFEVNSYILKPTLEATDNLNVLELLTEGEKSEYSKIENINSKEFEYSDHLPKMGDFYFTKKMEISKLLEDVPIKKTPIIINKCEDTCEIYNIFVYFSCEYNDDLLNEIEAELKKSLSSINEDIGFFRIIEGKQEKIHLSQHKIRVIFLNNSKYGVNNNNYTNFDVLGKKIELFTIDGVFSGKQKTLKGFNIYGMIDNIKSSGYIIKVIVWKPTTFIVDSKKQGRILIENTNIPLDDKIGLITIDISESYEELENVLLETIQANEVNTVTLTASATASATAKVKGIYRKLRIKIVSHKKKKELIKKKKELAKKKESLKKKKELAKKKKESLKTKKALAKKKESAKKKKDSLKKKKALAKKKKESAKKKKGSIKKKKEKMNRKKLI